jgi:hypothetical protein
MIAALLLGLSAPALAQSAPDNWQFKLDGYYRVRANAFGDLYQGQETAGTYMTHRVRLQPELDQRDYRTLCCACGPRDPFHLVDGRQASARRGG